MNIKFMKKEELREYCSEKCKKVVVYGEDIMENSIVKRVLLNYYWKRLNYVKN